MNSRKELNKEKYTIDKRIISILKKAPKRGIWMKDLAGKLNISRPLLNYYLYGMNKSGKRIGGRLKSKIRIKQEGNNQFVYIFEE